MKIGCCAGLDRMQLVQDLGYDYIELGVGTVKPESPDDEWEPISEEIKSYDIKPEAFNCFLPGDLRVTGPEIDKYRQERYVRNAFARIEEIGGEVVVFGSGGARKVPDGFDMAEAREQIVEFATMAGQVAGQHGITLVFEPLNKGETNVINSVAEGMEFVKAVDHPFVKVLADLYHVMEENEPLSHIRDAGEDLMHCHTADTGRLYPGSGSYPTKEFMTILKEIGYQGRLSVEAIMKDFDNEAPKALEFLRGVDKEVNG